MTPYATPKHPLAHSPAKRYVFRPLSTHRQCDSSWKQNGNLTRQPVRSGKVGMSVFRGTQLLESEFRFP